MSITEVKNCKIISKNKNGNNNDDGSIYADLFVGIGVYGFSDE
jgi:hypothetical protein